MVELGGAGKTGPHVPHDPAEKLGPGLRVRILELVPGKKRGKSSSGPVNMSASVPCRAFENCSWR